MCCCCLRNKIGTRKRYEELITGELTTIKDIHVSLNGLFTVFVLNNGDRLYKSTFESDYRLVP